MIELPDIRKAAARLDGVAHRTPVLTSRTLDHQAGASLFLKAECFQRGGAFKFRGAYHKLSTMPPADRARGVVAYSSGNHAQAVALAAALHDTHATIVMPEDSSPIKLDATRGYGATVLLYDRYTEDRVSIAHNYAAEHALTLIPPYDDEAVMAGQGTTALELLEDVGELDAIIVPVGGGGLIAGCATAAKGVSSSIRVIGVEPAVRDATRRSLGRDAPVRVPVPDTIADGQQTEGPGSLTFQVIRRRVDDVVLVSDDEIVDAMAVTFERLKLVIEPSGASALAAALTGRVPLAGQRVGVIVSGGNIGLDRFCEVTGRLRGPKR